MSDVGTEEENTTKDQVALTPDQKNMITTIAEQYIRDANESQGQEITKLQQHFSATDESKITVPVENDLHNALEMLNESQEGKEGFRNLTKSDWAQEMMKDVLSEMMLMVGSARPESTFDFGRC